MVCGVSVDAWEQAPAHMSGVSVELRLSREKERDSVLGVCVDWLTSLEWCDNGVC